MKILVRHPDGESTGRLAIHAEKLLRRILDDSCLSIESVEVKLKTFAGPEGRPEHRCILTIKLLAGGFLKAEALDYDNILSVYRAADRAKFLLDQRFKSVKK